MESVDVKCCLKTPVEHKTVNLDNVVLASDFRALLSVYFDIEPYSFDMVHLGTRIKDEQLLTQLGLKKGSVVFILKSRNVIPSGDSSYLTTFNTAANSLKLILSSKLARNTVATRLQHQKLLDSVIKAVPEFGHDPIAMSILTSKDLLWTFLNASDKQSVLSEHPSLAKAVMFLSVALKTEDLNKKVDIRDARALYGVDHMSDDDDDDEQAIRGNAARGPQRNVPAGFGNLFNMRPANQPPTPNDNQQAASGQPLITPDFFRQAMMMVANRQAGNMPAQPSAQSPMAAPQQGQALGEEDMRSKLQQLREMGITDEAMARRVLLETGGNLQMALEILFEGDM